MLRCFATVICGLSLVLATVWPAAAQEITASIAGAVVDETGGVLPGAVVTLRHVATGRVFRDGAADR
jgi:hypothetical protein